VVVVGRDPRHILAIGEAKGGEARRGIGDLRRLERLRVLLATRADAADARLLLFGRAGFAVDLVTAARDRKDVELIDLERLYAGE